MEPEELADSLRQLTAWAQEHAPTPESPVRRRLRDHFGGDLDDLPIVSRDLAAWDRPNFQVAVDARRSAGRSVEGSSRRRLLELYGEGLELTLTGDEPLIAALEGVSPAFIRELLRRAALLVAEESEGALSVSASDLERAFEELRHSTHDLTNALLGARPPTEDFDVS